MLTAKTVLIFGAVLFFLSGLGSAEENEFSRSDLSRPLRASGLVRKPENPGTFKSDFAIGIASECEDANRKFTKTLYQKYRVDLFL